jgi:hypothetical protein
MALAGCCPSIADLGNQLYSHEKRATLFFNLSIGFTENPYFICMPAADCIAQSAKAK